MSDIQKCAIVGAGFVGSTCAYTLATSGLFSELVLIDMNEKKARGEADDISHGIAFAQPCRVVAGDYPNLADCGLVIIAAGANQKPGETRIDLLQRNRAILSSILDSILAVNRDCVLLLVSNPVDILTYEARRISGYPESKVIGSGTVLDTGRLKYLLGRQLLVDSRSVHACIIGEHGDSELAVWSSANISGIDLDRFCQLRGIHDYETTLRQIYSDVRDSAYSIIERKTATYYGIAMAVARIASCIVRDEHTVLPVSTVLNGEYGLKELALSIPSIVGKKGVEAVLEIPLSESERLR